MKGPKPKPTALKLLEGNPGKRKLNKFEPTFVAGAPEMPWYLTPEAKEEWDRIVPALAAIPGLLKTIHGTALASYCMAFARWIEAEELITQYGAVVKEPVLSRDGTYLGDRIRRNPACAAAMAWQKEMRALLALFGMDPSSSSRLHAGSPGEKLSPLMQLLKSHEEGKAPPARQRKPEARSIPRPPSKVTTVQ
jgi:P27 family predicted phage terminase small subunit